MTIKSVEPIPCNSRWCMVRIETDTGLVGWGECGNWAWQTANAEAVRILGSNIIGMDPFKIEWIWEAMTHTPHMRGSIVNSAASGIDIALWDLKGKALGVPIYELLGGAYRDKIKCYETTSGSTAEEVANNVKALVDQGWKHVRVRPLSDNRTDSNAAMARKAEDEFRAIREVAGWDVDLSFEIHRQCTPQQAIMIGEALKPYRLAFIEDPLLDIPFVQKNLCDHIEIPVATGERAINIYELAYIISETNVTYTRPDFCVIGGITAAKKVAAYAEAHDKYIIPHNPLGPISTIAALHIDRACRNFEIQEWPGTFGDVNGMVIGDPLTVENGFCTMPEGPGLGITIPDNVGELFPFGGNKPRWGTNEDGSVRDS